jgi:hypothetical protein
MGRSQAEGGDDRVNRVHRLAFPGRERKTREAVKPLRRAGFLIGSALGENGD